MKLYVPLCKYCTIGKKTCSHRFEVREKVKEIKTRGSLSYNCALYPRILPLGTRVAVSVKEIKEIKETDGAKYNEWTVKGEFQGIVEKSYRKGFYRIKLDSPVIVNYPKHSFVVDNTHRMTGDWDDTEEIEILYIHKRLNDIKVL